MSNGSNESITAEAREQALAAEFAGFLEEARAAMNAGRQGHWIAGSPVQLVDQKPVSSPELLRASAHTVREVHRLLVDLEVFEHEGHCSILLSS